MALTGKELFKWLLIITMMIQPTLFSVAMASMDHAVVAAPQMQGHEMRHASGFHHSHHDKQQEAKVDNCCHTPACGPALMVDVVLTLQPLRPVYSHLHEYSLYDVDLPVNIRPPRTPS